MDDPALAAVLAVPETKKNRKHSPLYTWMKTNFGVLADDFDRKGPQWDARVAAMVTAGLTDGDGKPPTIRTAQATWYRVRARMEPKRRKRRAAATSAEEVAGVIRPEPDRERVRPTGYSAKPFEQPSRLADWVEPSVSREAISPAEFEDDHGYGELKTLGDQPPPGGKTP